MTASNKIALINGAVQQSSMTDRAVYFVVSIDFVQRQITGSWTQRICGYCCTERSRAGASAGADAAGAGVLP